MVYRVKAGGRDPTDCVPYEAGKTHKQKGRPAVARTGGAPRHEQIIVVASVIVLLAPHQQTERAVASSQSRSQKRQAERRINNIDEIRQSEHRTFKIQARISAQACKQREKTGRRLLAPQGDIYTGKQRGACKRSRIQGQLAHIRRRRHPLPEEEQERTRASRKCRYASRAAHLPSATRV